MGYMYFGVRGYMQWVPAPAINADFSRVGWQNTSQYLNGGAQVRRSYSGNKTYNLSWNLKSRDILRPITDYAEGVYGTGLVYMLDPMAMDKNLLPQNWGAPATALVDAMPLIRGVKPTAVDLGTVYNGYPRNVVVYPAVGTSEKIWVPVPPGYVLWVGVKGTYVGPTGVRATPTIGGINTATPTTITAGVVTDTARVTTSFDGNTYDGVELDLIITGNAAHTLTLANVTVQVLPLGAVPDSGGFISGQGHSGLSFESEPSVTAYSAVLDKVGMSVKMIETGQWQ